MQHEHEMTNIVPMWYKCDKYSKLFTGSIVKYLSFVLSKNPNNLLKIKVH